jgi:hypothetical protein
MRICSAVESGFWKWKSLWSGSSTTVQRSWRGISHTEYLPAGTSVPFNRMDLSTSRVVAQFAPVHG